ncbi:MAG: pyridoxamine 5'-phosphate oxidase family protein [Gemmatimonadota bacterium]
MRCGSGAARKLSEAEIRRFLRHRPWGVLATARDGRPYAVPVTFAFDEHAFCIASGRGRKADHL